MGQNRDTYCHHRRNCVQANGFLCKAKGRHKRSDEVNSPSVGQIKKVASMLACHPLVLARGIEPPTH